MNKEHFLIELKLHLRQLSLIDQQTILDKYNQLFDEKTEQSLTEYQITKELGSPKLIATSILKEFNIELKETKKPSNDWVEMSTTTETFSDTGPYAYQGGSTYRRSSSSFVRFFQIAGIICLNFLFMIWMIFSWAMILFSGWLVTIIFTLCPILGVFSFINYAGSYGMFQLSLSILFCGIGLIGFLIMIPFSKVSAKLLKTYSKWNLQVLRGDRAL